MNNNDFNSNFKLCPYCHKSYMSSLSVCPYCHKVSKLGLAVDALKLVSKLLTKKF